VKRFASIAATLAFAFAVPAARAAPFDDVGARTCAALDSRVTATSGAGPVLLRSYDDARGAGEPDAPALRTAAFAYDNALAVIALLACDRQDQALRVAEALRRAAMKDSRIRNAYRAGPVAEAPLANGWWDAKAARWIEDAYQDGSATGNVAWVALALLAAHDVTGDARWSDAASRLANYVIDTSSDVRGAGGFAGGVEGFDAAPVRLTWKSTEHNIDLVALFARLEGAHVLGHWQAAGATARKFVAAQWIAAQGHFYVGVLADGVTPNRDTSGLDVQLWAQLLPSVPAEWRRAIAYAEHEHGVTGGFDFNADRDGAWLEGTAQAALVYRVLGREVDAQPLFATIVAQISTGGYVYATREPRITTGLATSAASASADFYYYRQPHLAATAWAALAARKHNPFAAARP
jgi:hypothetical protein